MPVPDPDTARAYWSQRGIDPDTRRYTCCGVQAFDDLESNKPHHWSCTGVGLSLADGS